MFKKVVLVLIAIIAILAAVVAMQPGEFNVARSATIAAPPAQVFPHVNDLHAWQEWSPWAKIDPNAKTEFKGPPAGEGAIFRWSGNNEVGEGSMTITDSQPNERVRFRLDFVKPFAGTSTAEFNLKPAGNGTQVTWSMSGENNFIGKAIGLLMDCDKMIGEQFDKGLANLKSVAESQPAATTPEASAATPAEQPNPAP